MPSRMIDSGIWNHPEFQEMSIPAKLLYIYLWSNDQCNPAGAYRISDKTICDETNIHKEMLGDLFKELEKMKVERFPNSFVWIKSFIKRQTKSPKFLQGVRNALDLLSNKELAKKVREYNADILDVTGNLEERGKYAGAD